jgi:hypothetical protein
MQDFIYTRRIAGQLMKQLWKIPLGTQVITEAPKLAPQKEKKKHLKYFSNISQSETISQHNKALGFNHQ